MCAHSPRLGVASPLTQCWIRFVFRGCPRVSIPAGSCMRGINSLTQLLQIPAPLSRLILHFGTRNRFSCCNRVTYRQIAALNLCAPLDNPGSPQQSGRSIVLLVVFLCLRPAFMGWGLCVGKRFSRHRFRGRVRLLQEDRSQPNSAQLMPRPEPQEDTLEC